MNQIKFTDLLKLSDDEYKHLKLVFHNNWKYEHPENEVEPVRKVYGNDEIDFNLLEMYGHGQADLVKKSTTCHDPHEKRFLNGDVAFTFINYGGNDWLLVDTFKVLDDSKCFVEVDEKSMAKYEPYFGRLVITWPNRKTRNICMREKKNIENLTVREILALPYYEVAVEFPGYENVDLSWQDLTYVLKLKNWQTALKNQQGVYLITDAKTGKHYVGSASGKERLLGRWQCYAETGHGFNTELKKLPFDYIKKNFRYSILDIYKSSTDPDIVRARENWWKKILQTKEFGYNDN